MFEYFTNNYSFAVIGLSKKYNRTFSSREAANDYMYKLCNKYNLNIEEV
jgi:hypothetical protein